MSTREEIKKELKDLLKERNELLDLAKYTNVLLKFGTKYQAWYSRAIKVLEFLAPERLQEFKGYYEVAPKRKKIDFTNYNIQDYIMWVGARTDRYDKPLWDINDLVSIRILSQFQILEAISPRIDTIISDAEGHLYAEIQDAELEAASKLIKINLRAAGSLAGVVLERHLQRVAVNHGITIRKKNPTISDLNDPLKNANVYDTSTWRKIQYLADIRNICSHKKDKEPTKEQVEELIDGVNQVIKTVF